jgi:Tol biopolymer transport system component
MPLSVGDKLGPYEILGPIGAGGMGEVHRARDAKLNRDVAIKVLPAALANDADYLARFQREAQVLAALNHPNIAAIYGFEDHSIVMELVEGATLAERIAQGALSIDEALPITKQIAEALEAAHEKGIVHRDLKPGNVKITSEGTVKVLDFGLAKTAEARTTSDASNSPTLTIRATEAGLIMGTAGYMSPEQAAGKPVDKRADIWSFGVVLWEMLTGRRLFDGETISHTLADVLRAPIDFDKLPKETPQAIRDLLRRCLDRDIKTRLRDIGEARIALQKYLANPAGHAIASTAAPRHNWLWMGAAGVFALALAALAFVHFREKPPEAALMRFTIPPPENTTFVVTGPNANNGPPALSPDGRRLAFNARSADGKVQTWIRSLDTLTARPLQGTEGATHPFWSPDGRFLAFFADGKLKKIDASGGSPLTLCDAPGAVGGTWNREGVIVFTLGGGSLQKVSAGGGASTPLTSPDQTRHDLAYRWPWFLPDGRHFLYLAIAREHSSIRVGSLDSRESRPVLENQLNAIYAEGYVLYVRDTTLMAQPFDAKRLVTTGEAVPLADQIRTLPISLRGVFSASESGVLVYQTGARTATQLTWFDRTGRRTATLGDPGDIFSLEFSPDRKYVAEARTDAQAGRGDIWIYDVARGLKTRFTFDPADERLAVWSPDGRRVVFNSNRNGHFDLFHKQANGVGSEELLLADNLDKNPSSWSPDGKFLLYEALGDPKTRADVWVLPMTQERSREQAKPFPFAQTSFNEDHAQFSPDGRWIAYQSDESERFEIYVAPFPGPGGKRQISTAGGTQPRWRKDGKEIYYLAPGGQLTAAAVSVKGDVLDVGAASPLFSLGVTGGGYLYDVSADGQHFLARTEPAATAVQPLTMVQNWTAALKNK